MFPDPDFVIDQPLIVRTMVASEHVNSAVTTTGELFMWGYLDRIFPEKGIYGSLVCIQDEVTSILLNRENVTGITLNGMVFGWGQLLGFFCYTRDI